MSSGTARRATLMMWESRRPYLPESLSHTTYKVANKGLQGWLSSTLCAQLIAAFVTTPPSLASRYEGICPTLSGKPNRNRGSEKIMDGCRRQATSRQWQQATQQAAEQAAE